MVKREKFLEDAKADPPRFYRTPNDVLRDRRLSDDDRRVILRAWEARMHEGDGEEALLDQVRRALGELDDGENGDTDGARRKGSAH